MSIITDAANWAYQNPVDTVIAVAGVLLARQAYKDHQEAYRSSREMAAKWENMGHDRPKWPPRSLHRDGPSS